MASHERDRSGSQRVPFWKGPFMAGPGVLRSRSRVREGMATCGRSVTRSGHTVIGHCPDDKVFVAVDHVAVDPQTRIPSGM